MKAHIDELPNEVILKIFSHIEKFLDMIYCSYVCKRWHYLAHYRFNRIKGVMNGLNDYEATPNFLMAGTEESIYNIVKILPNLTIADNMFDDKSDSSRFTHAVMQLKKLRAVHCYFPHTIAKATILPNKLTGVATHYSRRYFRYIAYQIGPQLKQLNLKVCPFKILSEYVKYMPSLVRLQMQLKPVNPGYYYSGPTLENLQVLELVSENQIGNLTLDAALYMINYCPRLKSAYFCLRSEKYSPKLKPSRIGKHHHLQDLVLRYYANKQWGDPDYWKLLIEALKKYTNLKHLAIRDRCRITYPAVTQILEQLHNLKLLDILGAEFVDYGWVDEVNNKRKNPVELRTDVNDCYVDPEPVMNPPLDFMKYTFFIDDLYFLPKLYHIDDEE